MAAGFDLFLSYNSRDRETVRVIQQLLRTRGVRAFLDREALVPGLPWSEALEEALSTVSAVAIFIGAHELGAWQKREMAFALDRQAREQQAGHRFPVIPVLISDVGLDKAPAFLLLNAWIDLRARLDDPDALDALAGTVRRDARPQASAASPAALCPYRALRAFREEDAPLFFGCERYAAELLTKLHAHRLVAVVGPSGSGKSSVVHAGLLPLLRRQRQPAPAYDAVTFTPGKRPFHALAAALTPIWAGETSKTDMLVAMERLGNALASGEVSLDASIAMALNESPGTDRLLVIVDQFEELFTSTQEAERGRFAKTLLDGTASAPMTVVLTLRADFYGQAIGLSRDLSDRIQQGLVNIGPMTREELRRAVEYPARSAGLQFESGLVDRLLDHVEDQPGKLPLLEFALTELWERRTGRLLNHRGYDDSGGIEGAIGRRAEEQFSRLSPAEQAMTSRVFTRLVRVASAIEEGTDTRQRLSLNHFDATARSIIQSFVTARLLVVSRDPLTNEETVEIAHEALIRTWHRLTETLSGDRDFLLWRQRLGFTLNDWLRQKRDSSILLRGPLLIEARRVIRQRVDDLNDLEREFIRRSDTSVTRSRRWATAAVAAAAVLTLGTLGQVIWTRSDIYQVRRTFSEARTVLVAAGPSLAEWVHTLALVGRSREVLDFAATQGPDQRSRLFSAIAPALVRVGAQEEALVSALQVNDAWDRSRVLTTVLVAMARAGGATSVLTAADRIEDAFSLSPALMAAARDLLEHGQEEDAKRVARRALETSARIRDAYSRNVAAVSALGTLAATGATQEAVDAASSVEDSRWRASAFASVVQSLAVIRSSEQDPYRGFEPSRWSQMKAYANAGRGADAFELAFRGSGAGQSPDVSPVVFELSRSGADLQSIVNDALTAAQRVNAEYVQLAALVEAAETLAKTGKDKTALEAALNIPRRGYRCAALRRVATALAKTGQHQQAIDVARQDKDRCIGSTTYLTILETTLESGRTENAQAVVREFFDFRNEPRDEDHVARLTAAIAKIYGARSALRQLQYVNDRGHVGEAIPPTSLMTVVVKTLARSAKAEELLGEARQFANRQSKSAALVAIAEILAAAGERTRAISIIEEARLSARIVFNDPERSTAMAQVGTAFARLHLYRRAWEVAQFDVSSSDGKLAIHSAIVREYYLERNTALAKAFESLANDLKRDRLY